MTEDKDGTYSDTHAAYRRLLWHMAKWGTEELTAYDTWRILVSRIGRLVEEPSTGHLLGVLIAAIDYADVLGVPHEDHVIMLDSTMDEIGRGLADERYLLSRLVELSSLLTPHPHLSIDYLDGRFCELYRYLGGFADQLMPWTEIIDKYIEEANA